MLKQSTPAQRILAVDEQLLLAGQRLAQYRGGDTPSSYIVQMGVCDRLLDRRLEAMADRDAGRGSVR